MRFVATSADIVILRRATEKFGLRFQCVKGLEEMAELSVVLTKFLNSDEPNCLSAMVDEIADVYIMLHQLGYGFDINEAVDLRVDFKMERLLTLVL